MTAAEPDWMTTVLRSVSGEEPSWRLLAGWTADGHLMNSLRFDGAQPYIAGGFGGPPVWPGEIFNHWHGSGLDDRLYVVVRALPRVTGIWASLDQERIPIPLSDPHPDFGLRFGACQLPANGRSARDVRPLLHVA